MLHRTLRITLFAALTVLIAQPLHAADEASQAQALIDRAIEAMGGKKALGKTVNTIVDDKGMYYGMGQAVPYVGRYVYHWSNPSRYRMEIIGQFIMVTDGDKAWISVMGMVLDQEGEALQVAKQGNLVGYAMSLIPLQEPNKAFKLSLAEPDTVEGEQCDGIKIDHDNMPAVTMHFSRKTGLIKKTKYKIKAAEQGFEYVTDEATFHDYKEFDGFKSPTKILMYRDGKKFVESFPQKVSYPEKLDESEFKKPE